MTGRRARVAARALGAGLCLAAALPPWGWWPLAFVGMAVIDGLLTAPRARTRFRRLWLVGIAWFLPSMLWMLDLTAPGYVIAVAAHGAGLGLAGAVSPSSRWRRLVFPGAVVLFELVRWSVPFGGVPLATLAMTQAQTPWAPAARVLGSLLLVAVVVVVGMGLAALVERHWPSAIAAGGFCVLVGLGMVVAPRSTTVDTFEVAIVQGGGEQRTRASAEGAKIVFDRHLEMSGTIEPDSVDLVLWPENVVNPETDFTGEDPDDRLLSLEEAEAGVAAEAARLGAPLLPGWFYPVSDTETVNYTDVWLPDGTVMDRYDKVRTVPFGEFVPLRGLIEPFAEESLPRRDVRPGEGPAVLDTPEGPMGIVISWEVFFDHRARDAIGNGGTVLLNPTNGSSYWLTILQTQQLATSRLRALETDRWVLQAAPTGFSAVIDADGSLRQRTGIAEAGVLYATVDQRTGLTWAVRWGVWPMVGLAVAAVAAGLVLDRRDRAGPTPR